MWKVEQSVQVRRKGVPCFRMAFSATLPIPALLYQLIIHIKQRNRVPKTTEGGADDTSHRGSQPRLRYTNTYLTSSALGVVNGRYKSVLRGKNRGAFVEVGSCNFSAAGTRRPLRCWWQPPCYRRGPPRARRSSCEWLTSRARCRASRDLTIGPCFYCAVSPLEHVQSGVWSALCVPCSSCLMFQPIHSSTSTSTSTSSRARKISTFTDLRYSEFMCTSSARAFNAFSPF